MSLRWETDDRPRSWFTHVYVAGMWLRRDKDAFEGAEHTLVNAQQLQERGDARPTRLTHWLRRVSATGNTEMPVWRVRPRRGEVGVRVLYVHGGGYVHPLTPDYWRLARALSHGPVEVVLPGYPLAPDATVDDVLPRLIALYDELSDLPVVLMGDSAGGALVLAMALRLRERGGRQPALVVGLSPWLDAALDDPEVADLESTDPMLAESGLRAAGVAWAGTRSVQDPLVSPVNADLSGLPPLHVWIGDRDILRPAVNHLADHAERDGASLHVHEVSSMFHVWMTRAIPEGRRTRKALNRLVLSAV